MRFNYLEGMWREKLKTIVDSIPISQTRIAQRAGIPISNLNRWVNDEEDLGPRLANQQKLADAVGVTVAQLFGPDPLPERVSLRLMDPKTFEKKPAEVLSDAASRSDAKRRGSRQEAKAARRGKAGGKSG